jgi:hypothetical protein
MTGVQAALWGLFGGFAVEGLDLITALRRRGWPWRVEGPPEAGPVGYAVAELIRLIIGGGVAWAVAASGQITGPAGALAVGAAAPLIVERLTSAVPLTEPAPVLAPSTDAQVVRSLNVQMLANQPAESAPDIPVDGSQAAPVRE